MTNLFARTLERIPQDVRILADDAAVQVAGATNIFLTPLGLVDSDGGRVDHYALFFTTNLFNPIGGVIAAVVGFLHLLFMVVAGYAVWLIEAIVNPDKLLGWMSGLFQSLTSRVYAVFPPQALVAATFAILILRIFLQQNPADVKIGGSTISKTRLSKAHWQRLASGFALMGLVLALAANPFRLAQIVLSGVSTFAAFLTGNDSAALHRAMVSGTVDQILKPMTQLLTYHDTLTPQCSAVWSAAVNSGNAASVKSCLTPEQVQATSPGHHPASRGAGPGCGRVLRVLRRHHPEKPGQSHRPWHLPHGGPVLGGRALPGQASPVRPPHQGDLLRGA